MFEQELLAQAKKNNFNFIEYQEKGYLYIFTGKFEDLHIFISEIKNNHQLKFSILTDLTATDYPDKDHRFELVYNLLSLKNNIRIIIKIPISGNIAVESITNIYSAANWYEREVWDMYGIKFLNHSNLERLLTDYGFEGHPLRKDFPLTGFKEVRYDQTSAKVIYEDVSLPQEYRDFDFMTPWQGNNILPGDEKVNNNALDAKNQEHKAADLGSLNNKEISKEKQKTKEVLPGDKKSQG